MANQHRSDTGGHPQPNVAAQDPHDAAVQRQIHADTEVNRQQAERLKATQPPAIDEKTVEEIAANAEQRAKR